MHFQRWQQFAIEQQFINHNHTIVKNKNLHINSFTLLFIVLVVLPLKVFSAGTPAGTIIKSRTLLTYTTQSGNRTDSTYSDYVSITVSQVAAVNITPVSNQLATLSDSVWVNYPITILNSGNGNDVFLLNTTSSRNFQAQIFHDADGDGILQSGELLAGAISVTQTIAADDTDKIILRVFVPRDETLNGKTDTTTVTVTSQFSSAKFIVGMYRTIIQTVNISSMSSGLTVDNNNPNPLQNITFTLSFTNTGSVSATNLVLSHLYSSFVSVISGTSSQGTFNSSGNPVQWNIGTLAPNATITITLTVQIHGDVPPNTIIQTAMVASYSVGNNSFTHSSNTVSVTVGSSSTYGVNIEPMWSSLTKESGDTALYRFRITNIGIYKEVIELDTAFSNSFAWKLYRDNNSNGKWDASDLQLTNTNTSYGLDVDSVAAGDSVRIFAVAILPRLYVDQAQHSLRLKAFSSIDTSFSSTVNTTTTVNTPVISTTLTPSPVGDLAAGTVVTYTIAYSNTGHASVVNFAVSDPIPQFTDYVANSVKINGVSVSDDNSAVSFTTNAENKKIITIAIGTLQPQVNGIVEFKVKIQ